MAAGLRADEDSSRAATMSAPAAEEHARRAATSMSSRMKNEDAEKQQQNNNNNKPKLRLATTSMSFSRCQRLSTRNSRRSAAQLAGPPGEDSRGHECAPRADPEAVRERLSDTFGPAEVTPRPDDLIRRLAARWRRSERWPAEEPPHPRRADKGTTTEGQKVPLGAERIEFKLTKTPLEREHRRHHAGHSMLARNYGNANRVPTLPLPAHGADRHPMDDRGASSWPVRCHGRRRAPLTPNFGVAKEQLAPQSRGVRMKLHPDQRPPKSLLSAILPLGVQASVVLLIVAAAAAASGLASAQSLSSDPRPTIYSGQVSFGLLLSAHSSPGAELASAAAAASSHHYRFATSAEDLSALTTQASASTASPPPPLLKTTPQFSALRGEPEEVAGARNNQSLGFEKSDFDAVAPVSDLIAEASSSSSSSWGELEGEPSTSHRRRQIFERPSAQHHMRRQQQQAQAQQLQQQLLSKQQMALDSACSQANPSALYAGMSAIWASHQANLVGDSQLAIGTYVYDSCNDLDIGQRQSVRIVSNLNAFQQTTCEAPRGSPISLTIAHGDNQLRAIQLLTSFKVPVITTREPFALEDFHLLSRDQRRFLFSTAPSSRHLAVGALKFTRRVVSRSTSSPKLPNQFHKMSSKNGLIVISRNLPAKFITYLIETIPNHVNYEMLQSDQPIDQVRSVEVLESILMLNGNGRPGGGSSSASSSSSQAGGGSSGPGSSAESRISRARLKLNSNNEPHEHEEESAHAPSATAAAAAQADKARTRRSLTSDDSDASGSTGSDSDDSSSAADQAAPNQQRMLSPTILMFITPSEAIDLITRLRNDLAEVSRYYSLIVTTREDISPALRTIFHRGGARLCSGKAFYTISPKPDEVHEFSRYFRDTVQMEGESSDHPLICEFAKHQALSRSASASDLLDDISAESVIKAVWSAAAAFKLVHKRECGAANELAAGDAESPSSGSNFYSGRTANGKQHKQGRRQSLGANQTSSSGSGTAKATPAQSECMAKMSKSMSSLVQRALRKLDVTINSTGLQALDGSRLKFDEANELLTNKFSIKYINKECEITELGAYSGTKDSQLHLDEEILAKSLESTVPDPWPLSSSSSTTSGKGASSAPETSTRASASTNSLDAPAASADDGTSSGGGDSSSSGSPDSPSLSPSASTSDGDSQRTSSGDDEHGGSADDKLPSITLESDSPKRKRSNPKLARRKIQQQDAPAAATTSTATTTTTTTSTTSAPTRQQQQQPVSMSSGRGNAVPGLSDSTEGTRAEPTSAPSARVSTNGPSLPGLNQYNVGASQQAGGDTTTPKSMRKLKPFPDGSSGASLKEWLPKGRHEELPIPGPEVTTTQQPPSRPAGGQQVGGSARHELAQGSSTTQAPVYSTLPESGGNTDLEMPAFKGGSQGRTASTSAPPSSTSGKPRSALEAAASALTETSSDYVTLPSIVRHLSDDNNLSARVNTTHRSLAALPMGDDLISQENPRLSYLRDLNASPIPLTQANSHGAGARSRTGHSAGSSADHQQNREQTDEQRSSRSRLRSHLKWIYGSWFTLTILAANVCGALLTLYVLTFLLMKNCDGSLDRENQGVRSMHLLAIIVVFFGSTLFIVYPTPSLCLLRTSWHNFALVLVFGSLLLQTMQTRSISSIGLGGRPNRLNQFLTLVFMVGVQVSFELQRWKYESANYIQFVNQYFNSQENGEKKLIIFSNSISGHFNPLNSFNDQVTPVSIQLSEKYQSLLHDYCTQPVEDYLQSQIYLWLIIGLLIVFSVTSRRRNVSGNGLLSTSSSKSTPAGGGKKSSSAALGNYNLTSGKLLATQHETNDFMQDSSLSHHQTFSGGGPFSPANHLGLVGATKGVVRWGGPKSVAGALGNVFIVTLISAPIYFFSVIMYVHGQDLASADLVASVSMVLIAFTVLLGTFMPLMRNYHKYGELSTSGSDHHQLTGGGQGGGAASLSQPILSSGHHHLSSGAGPSYNHRRADKSLYAANRRSLGASANMTTGNSPPFMMFPEFAATGLRRPSSMGGDSNSNSGGTTSRRPFVETKESRRNMGLSLANLPEPIPAADSLRSLCAHNSHMRPQSGSADHHHQQQMKLNLPSPSEEGHHHHHHGQSEHHHHNHHHHHHESRTANGRGAGSSQHRKSQPYPPSRRSSASSSGEKRLIMLDVDPCCPRHGVVTTAPANWTATTSHRPPSGCIQNEGPSPVAGRHGGGGPANK